MLPPSPSASLAPPKKEVKRTWGYAKRGPLCVWKNKLVKLVLGRGFGDSNFGRRLPLQVLQGGQGFAGILVWDVNGILVLLCFDLFLLLIFWHLRWQWCLFLRGFNFLFVHMCETYHNISVASRYLPFSTFPKTRPSTWINIPWLALCLIFAASQIG